MWDCNKYSVCKVFLLWLQYDIRLWQLLLQERYCKWLHYIHCYMSLHANVRETSNLGYFGSYSCWTCRAVFWSIHSRKCWFTRLQSFPDCSDGAETVKAQMEKFNTKAPDEEKEDEDGDDDGGQLWLRSICQRHNNAKNNRKYAKFSWTGDVKLMDEGAYMLSHTWSAVLRQADSGRCGRPVENDREVTPP